MAIKIASATGHEMTGLETLMNRVGIPVTRDNYLTIAYLGDPPEEWGAELEMELPPRLRLDGRN
jgi:hypothetical protein